MFVPYTELSPEALRGVVESFVLREGTDYGEREYSLDQKLAHVYRQLERGEAQIVFDPSTETIDIIRAEKESRPAVELSAEPTPSRRSKPE
ncbi:MAG TPA: YheU family protein [Chloroflexota bacterium]